MPLCDYAPAQCLSAAEFAGLASVVAPPDGTVHDYIMVDVISGGLPVNWSIVFKENGILYKNKISGQTQADHPLLELRSVRTRLILVWSFLPLYSHIEAVIRPDHVARF